MKRRDFIKATAASTAVACGPEVALARPNLEPAENAVGMLFDSTLCVGCKACVSMCKQVNDMPPVIEGSNKAWDSARDLSPQTLNVIKVYKNGTAESKDKEIDGFCFEKRSCMHCVDPGCVSVCPVTAMRRDPLTGIVTYHADACIGCRNCMMGCPYNVPQFEYDEAFGQIQKCQMCNQAGVERINNGQMTGCAEVCPTGATLFGTRKKLLKEAKRRIAMKEGKPTIIPVATFPNQIIPMRKPYQRINSISGVKQKTGGTNVLHISAIPFDKLGMPPLKDRSAVSIAEGVQHGIYSYLALPAVALAGLSYVVRRNAEQHDDEGGES